MVRVSDIYILVCISPSDYTVQTLELRLSPQSLDNNSSNVCLSFSFNILVDKQVADCEPYIIVFFKYFYMHQNVMGAKVPYSY